MGFFDKAKQFLGGKGMADVTITVIERQPAETATFPVRDSVLKGTMVIDAKQDCTLLATKYEVWLYIKKDDIDSPNLAAQDYDPRPNVGYGEGSLIMPRDLKAGEQITKHWMVDDVDCAAVLAKNGFPDAHKATMDSRVRLVVKCIADVKGSPFDPCAEVNVKLISA
jgi:hypothetical protein